MNASIKLTSKFNGKEMYFSLSMSEIVDLIPYKDDLVLNVKVDVGFQFNEVRNHNAYAYTRVLTTILFKEKSTGNVISSKDRIDEKE